MSDLTVLGLVFVCVFGAAVGGFLLRPILRGRHMTEGTKDVVNVTTGVVASIAALVLGLLIAAMQESYDAKDGDVRSVVVNATLLGRSLRLYEPDLAADRQQLATFVTALKQRLWYNDAKADPLHLLDVLREDIRKLNPQTDPQKILQTRMIALSDVLIFTGDDLVEGTNSSIPVPLVVIVIVWLSAIFLGFGLFAPVNATTTGALAIGAASVSMAVFLIVTLNGPFNGVIQISTDGFDRAAAEVSAP